MSTEETTEKRYAVDMLVSVRVWADSPEEANTLAQTSTRNWDDWFHLETQGEPIPEQVAGKPWTAVAPA